MKILKTIFIFTCLTLFSDNTFSQIPEKTNIIIYCDLSDRLVRNKQVEIDKKLINHVLSEFKNIVKDKYVGGQMRTNDKLSIHFNPPIAGVDLASSLEIDFSRIEKNKKLKEFIKLFPKEGDFALNANVNTLYDKAMAQYPKFPGSDFYGFVKNDLKYLCEEDYNNILIVLSDGYIYMNKNNPKHVGNKLGHLEGSNLDPLRKLNNSWESEFKNGKWGLVSTDIKLNNLNVLVLEVYADCINNPTYPRTKIRPLKNCLYEFDILNAFWENWFTEMGVNNFKFVRKQDNLNPAKNSISSYFK